MTDSTLTRSVPTAVPPTGRHAHEIQPFGSVKPMPIALAEGVRLESATNLNQLLADTITLRDLYKKHHWQVSGATFYQLHLLFDKHVGDQSEWKVTTVACSRAKTPWSSSTWFWS